MNTHSHVRRLIVIAHCFSQETLFFHLFSVFVHWTLFPFHDHSSFVRKESFLFFMKKGELIYFCWADPDHLFYAQWWSSRMKRLLTSQSLVMDMIKTSGAQESISTINMQIEICTLDGLNATSSLVNLLIYRFSSFNELINIVNSFK